MKPLPKKVTSKMTLREKTKLARLEKEFKKIGDDMEKVQSKATQYTRKHKNPTTAQVKRQQVLDNAGLKAFYFFNKKADELNAFREKLRGRH